MLNGVTYEPVLLSKCQQSNYMDMARAKMFSVLYIFHLAPLLSEYAGEFVSDAVY